MINKKAYNNLYKNIFSINKNFYSDFWFNPELKSIIRKENIEKIAYFLWIDAGRPEGRDLEFWLLAEKKYENKRLLDTFRNKKNAVS